MPRNLIFSGALLLLASAGSSGPQAAPGRSDPVEGGAWLKIFSLTSGGLEPVVLSEAEVNALLASAQLAALLVETAGLSRVEARLLPEEVRLSGEMDAARIGAALGPLAPRAEGRAQQVEASVRIRGARGSGEATILRGAIAGQELPPALIREALLDALAGAGRLPGEGDGEAPWETALRTGTPFPLPQGLDAIEVGSGEIRLTPASR